MALYNHYNFFVWLKTVLLLCKTANLTVFSERNYNPHQFKKKIKKWILKLKATL